MTSAQGDGIASVSFQCAACGQKASTITLIRPGRTDPRLTPEPHDAPQGISIDNVMRQLEDEGFEKFNTPFDKLMETLAQRSSRHLTRGS
jgi:hypothetical protein